MAKQITIPDHTAVRVALWRAIHAQLDAKPSVLEDELGLQLVSPDPSWRQRPDMHPEGTKGYRAAIVARARYIEDLVLEQAQHGVHQYVILGSGLDTFAQRKSASVPSVQIFEIDEPQTQAWKQQRLKELGLSLPKNLHFVPVDFEAGDSWLEKLAANGFDLKKPAVVASTGVAMYLTREANLDTLSKIAKLASGSTLAMTFMLPTDMVPEPERPMYEMVQTKAREAGTPFLSLFRPNEALDLAREAGFKNVKHVSRADLVDLYFSKRSDGLLPATGEEFLIAKT